MKAVGTLCWILLLALPSVAQIKSDIGKLAEAPPNSVDVRFAVDKKTITCDQFSLNVGQGARIILDGKFASRFALPAGEPKSSTPPLEVTIGCSGYIWHFDHVPTAMFQRGWWFVGTDYPPFQNGFSCPKFANFRLIRYVQYVRNDGHGFDYYETVPRSSDTGSDACSGK